MRIVFRDSDTLEELGIWYNADAVPRRGDSVLIDQWSPKGELKKPTRFDVACVTWSEGGRGNVLYVACVTWAQGEVTCYVE